MPLVGVKCCRTGKTEPFEGCMRAALTSNPGPCKWPFPLLAYMAESEGHRKGVGTSVTELSGCARAVILKKLYPYTSSPEDYWARFRGSVGHEMINGYRKFVDTGIAEVRLFKDYVVDGAVVTLSGQPDWQVDDFDGTELGVGNPVGAVTDFKSTQGKLTPETAVKEDHYRQVHAYADLFDGGTRGDTGEEVAKTIRVGQVVYFNMETAHTVTFPVVTEGTAAWIIERLKPYLHHRRTGQLPDVLPSRVVKFGKATQIIRHPFCKTCPVRGICDSLASEGK